MRRIVLIAAIGVALVAPTSAAGAATPASVGWWLNRDGSVPTAVTPAPTVPRGGLYVEGQLTGPRAIAAVRYAIADGARPRSLTLALASQSGTVLIDVCPPAHPWKSVEGGAWADRAAQDCGTNGSRRVTGKVDSGATTVTFALTPALVTDGLDLVLAPGVDPATSATAVFQATFKPPAADSLVVSNPDASDGQSAEAVASSPVPSDGPASADAPAATASFEAVSAPASSGSGVSDDQSTTTGSGSDADASAFDAGGAKDRAGAGRGALTMSGGRRAAAVVVALTMLLLLLWINRFALLERAGVPVNGVPAVRSAAPTASVVGVGRFARPREGSAPPL